MPTAMPTSDVLDFHPDASVSDTAMHLLGLHRSVAGRIRTIRCLEDNGLVKSILAHPPSPDIPGEILVVDAGCSLRIAILGDRIASSAIANGWRGVIIFGAVRDSAALEILPFHVKALGFVPRKSAKLGSGEIDVPLHCGGITFTPGHVLYSDSDGVVVLPDFAA
ncbi:ribonuclease E activity regulator RraA [Granulicella tundricola]|uniref:4-hydroxy-4-methyl-2-oxoglutarate aldolase n=1 Tax=Granulicella tundricola (strain ATCC BAA-1859 / DSM 23138 / MP5ACTX9) TaxID=1198114 RepID=E8WYI8_GRATM|nr:ribonuclease E activity regulator RraA [Granulicella tundricola]ADW67586.1 regulator of ribonuclease activity A [Granulicella tundricola MP5ACTX9]